jgi:hypothetical protein
VHPFWSSHEEKRACVRLSMGGGHGRSWSFHGELNGEGEGGGGEGGTARDAMGALLGRWELDPAAPLSVQPLFVPTIAACVRKKTAGRKEKRRKKKKRKKGKIL